MGLHVGVAGMWAGQGRLAPWQAPTCEDDMDLLAVLLLGRLELLVLAAASGLRFSSIQLPLLLLLPLVGAASGTSGASALLVLLSRSRSALASRPSICLLRLLRLPGASAAWKGERT
jgi:hypothetical protein